MSNESHRARRAAGPTPDAPRQLSRSVAAIAVVTVCLALLAALAVWVVLPRLRPAATPAAPTPPIQAATATPTEDDKAAAERQLASCRLKVAAGDRVLAEARTVLTSWSEHLRATADFDANAITIEQRAATWDRTAAEAGPAVARRNTAADEWNGVPDCQWVAGAPAEEAKRLDACTLRLTMMRKAMTASERPIADWTRHLRDEAAHAADPRTRGDSERSWIGSRYAIDEWSDADSKYAAAPACR